ncbi:NUDIX hydrolase [Candidatus Gracilibacteria bacterium]|nr:NUDIX hydrolase [Candidatus Gracilibacteria bacterium]
MADNIPNIPNCYYRVSVKALITDNEGKFLLIRENVGKWELPGGGLDFGENPRDGLIRELKEEMNLDVVSISEKPLYFFTCFQNNKWRANVLYKTEVQDLNFTPSDECEEIGFFTPEEALKLPLFDNVIEFCKHYKI